MEDVEKFMRYDGLGMQAEIIDENNEKRHCGGVTALISNQMGDVYVQYINREEEIYDNSLITAVSGECLMVPLSHKYENIDLSMETEDGNKLRNVKYIRDVSEGFGKFKVEYRNGKEEILEKSSDMVIRGAGTDHLNIR
ncbi:hypothetical protein [Natronosalvus hydrolyticus]